MPPPAAGSAGAGSMRVDMYLHRVCILKSRTLAREACDRGKVRVNGETAKAAREVAPGDRIRLDLGVRVVELEVAAVPAGSVSRKDAPGYYRLLRAGARDDHGDEQS